MRLAKRDYEIERSQWDRFEEICGEYDLAYELVMEDGELSVVRMTLEDWEIFDSVFYGNGRLVRIERKVDELTVQVRRLAKAVEAMNK